MNYLYAVNFAPGFEELVAYILKPLGCEVVFSEEAFALVQFKARPDLKLLRFAKSIIEVFDCKDEFGDLKLVVPEGFVSPEAKTFAIRSFEAGRPSKLDSEKRTEIIKEISNKTKLRYSSFEPDVDFVIARRRDGKSYFGFKLPVGAVTKINKGELHTDIVNLLLRLGQVESGARVLDAFTGYGGVSRELLKSFNPESVVMVEKDSKLVNSLKIIFKLDKRARVVAGDVVGYLKNSEYNFDLIVSDPPWGEFEDYIGDLSKLYFDFLIGAKSKIKEDGKIVMLSSKKGELEKAAMESGLNIEDKLNVLISGKKVLVLKLG
jgi:16S rRNA G966 N2-methylase RsmD